MVLAQAGELIEKTGQIARESGWQTALLVAVIVGGGVFIAWLVRFLLNVNREDRQAFIKYQENRDEKASAMTKELADAIHSLKDEIRRPRR